MDKGISQSVFPGAVVLVAKDSTVVFRKAYGYSTVTPVKEKMTEETLFDVASMTKCVCTAAAVMKLYEQGLVDLQDPVKKYFPNFKPWSNGKMEADITIQQLLTHSSGLSAGISRAEASRLRKAWNGHNTSKAVDYIGTHTPRNFQPGTKRLYSCLNYIVLQGLVERITDKRLNDFATANIFLPLNMLNTHFFPEEESIPDSLRIASTETANGSTLKGRVHDPLAQLLNGGVSGNAGLFTNVDDLAKYCFFILYGNDDVLKKSTIKDMVTIPASDSKQVGRALGWEVNSSYVGRLNKHQCICHTGYTGTSIVIDLTSKISIILLTNRVHPHDLPEKKKELMTIRRALSDIIADALSQ